MVRSKTDICSLELISALVTGHPCKTFSFEFYCRIWSLAVVSFTKHLVQSPTTSLFKDGDTHNGFNHTVEFSHISEIVPFQVVCVFSSLDRGGEHEIGGISPFTAFVHLRGNFQKTWFMVPWDNISQFWGKKGSKKTKKQKNHDISG